MGAITSDQSGKDHTLEARQMEDQEPALPPATPPFPQASAARRLASWGRANRMLSFVTALAFLFAVSTAVFGISFAQEDSYSQTLKHIVAAYADELRAQQESKDAVTADLRDAEATIATAEAEIEPLQGHVEELQQQVSGLKGQLQSLQEKYEDTRSQLQQQAQEGGYSVEAVSTFGSGTYRVGEEIQPGTYRSPGGSSCYWERLSGFSGNLDDIIANGGFEKNQVVTIAPSDAGFSSSDCGEWTKI